MAVTQTAANWLRSMYVTHHTPFFRWLFLTSLWFNTHTHTHVWIQRDHSMLTFESAEFAGTANIVKKLQELPFTKVSHQVQTLDAQPSNPGNPSLLVLVTGTLTVSVPFSFSRPSRLQLWSDECVCLNMYIYRSMRRATL